MPFDLIVVGTGFASSFFLYQYLRHAGPQERVLVLERGFVHLPSERIALARGEISKLSSAVITEPEAATFSGSDKAWVYSLEYGGGSNCWYACTPRFLPADFEMKTRYGQGQDWPLSYEDLIPYYEDAEAMMSVSGPAGGPWPGMKGFPQPPHQFNAVDQLMHRAYGDLYVQQPTARSRVADAGRNACCNNGVCSLCPVNAKFSLHNAQWSPYSDPRVEVRYGCQVYTLETQGGEVKGVRYKQGEEDFSVQADVIALGANAIFNAHILLNSDDPNPFTGKGLVEQVSQSVRVELDGLDNVGGSTIISGAGYMGYDLQSRAEKAGFLLESYNMGQDLRTEKDRWFQIANFKFVFEDLPQEQNQVQRSDDLLKPLVHFEEYSPYALRGLNDLAAELGQWLSPLPVERLIIPSKPNRSESHVLGTTRMAGSAVEGVVDADLIHHHWRNVFVLGGGAFPTISPSNPTLTISALSLRAADRVFGSTLAN